MNRQQALNQLRNMQAWHEDNGNGPCPDYDAICYAIGVIEEMPEGMDTLIKALEAEHKKLREMQVVPPEKCEKCMMEHLDEMEKLEVELEMQKAQLGTNLAEVGTDTISRQAAIDALKNLTANGTNRGMICGEDAVHRIEMLPFAQPVIIHCQNCKFYQSNYHWCELLESEWSLTDFCSYAERRTDDQRRSNQTI